MSELVEVGLRVSRKIDVGDSSTPNWQSRQNLANKPCPATSHGQPQALTSCKPKSQAPADER
jgi:hypothetical protein